MLTNETTRNTSPAKGAAASAISALDERVLLVERLLPYAGKYPREMMRVLMPIITEAMGGIIPEAQSERVLSSAREISDCMGDRVGRDDFEKRAEAIRVLLSVAGRPLNADSLESLAALARTANVAQLKAFAALEGGLKSEALGVLADAASKNPGKAGSVMEVAKAVLCARGLGLEELPQALKKAEGMVARNGNNSWTWHFAGTMSALINRLGRKLTGEELESICNREELAKMDDTGIIAKIPAVLALNRAEPLSFESAVDIVFEMAKASSYSAGERFRVLTEAAGPNPAHDEIRRAAKLAAQLTIYDGDLEELLKSVGGPLTQRKMDDLALLSAINGKEKVGKVLLITKEHMKENFHPDKVRELVPAFANALKVERLSTYFKPLCSAMGTNLSLANIKFALELSEKLAKDNFDYGAEKGVLRVLEALPSGRSVLELAQVVEAMLKIHRQSQPHFNSCIRACLHAANLVEKGSLGSIERALIILKSITSTPDSGEWEGQDWQGEACAAVDTASLEKFILLTGKIVSLNKERSRLSNGQSVRFLEWDRDLKAVVSGLGGVISPALLERVAALPSEGLGGALQEEKLGAAIAATGLGKTEEEIRKLAAIVSPLIDPGATDRNYEEKRPTFGAAILMVCDALGKPVSIERLEMVCRLLQTSDIGVAVKTALLIKHFSDPIGEQELKQIMDLASDSKESYWKHEIGEERSELVPVLGKLTKWHLDYLCAMKAKGMSGVAANLALPEVLKAIGTNSDEAISRTGEILERLCTRMENNIYLHDIVERFIAVQGKSFSLERLDWFARKIEAAPQVGGYYIGRIIIEQLGAR